MLRVFKMKWGIVLFVVAAVYLQSSDAQDNKIPSRELPSEYQPMYLIPGTTDFWPHNEGGYLVFEDRKTIELHCESGFRYPNTLEKKLTATYIGGINLMVDDKQYTIREIRCKRELEVDSSVQSTIDANTKIVNFGYQIGPKFKSIYQIYFDYEKMVAKYVKYTLRPGVLSRKRVNHNFMDIPSFDPYRFKGFYDNIPREFDRGHLAADGDFFYGVEQTATYAYPNISPQSKSFNGHEWSEMERLIRSNQHNRIFECYTGVLDVLSFQGENELYLDKAGKKIPVPKLFFKAVYEPSTKRAVVFLGVNDRFGKGRPVPICTNIIGQLDGIKFKKPNNQNFYACEYNDFRQNSKYNVRYMPDLSVTELLFKERFLLLQ